MESHETAEEHLRHAVMYEAELRRRLQAALRELEADRDRCERPLRELEKEPERKDEEQ
jgi:hypothetical protein